MPSQLVNFTLSNLSSGVTQQYQEGRFDSQVNDMINCIPNLTRGVLRRNPINTRGILPGLPANLTDAYVYTYDRGTGDEQYMVTVPGDGKIYVHNVNTGILKYTSPTSTYLSLSIGQIARETFKAMTIGDTTFIVNISKTPKFTTATTPTTGFSDMAFYWIKKTASVVTEQKQTQTDPITTGSYLKGYTYDLNGEQLVAHINTLPGVTEVQLNTGPDIATYFASKALAVVDKSSRSIAYKTGFTGSDWTWSDSFGDEASLGVWETIDSASKLPVNLPSDLNNFVVQVTSGTSDAFDDYYLQYDYPNKSWKEVTKPGVLFELDGSSMPHALYRLASGNFTFNTFQEVAADGLSLTGTSAWGDRVVGGSDSIEDPSFLLSPIIDIFFFRNRLGFLTKDNIILSQTGAYGDFFLQTIQDTLDDDPIDLAVASTDVTVLRHAVPTAGQLVLFSDDTQFILRADNGPLTVNTAEITALSNYTYGKDADAKAVGNKIYFSSQAGGFSQMYAYNVTDGGQQLTEAVNLSLHIPTYMSNTINKIVGHSVLGFTFLKDSTNPKELTVLSSVNKQNDELQRAFHKWEFSKNIVDTSIINNDLYLLFSDGDLCYMSLEVPGDIDTIVYNDTHSDGIVDYLSGIKFSEFFVRDGSGKGTTRGRLQLRTLLYTINDDSKYQTELISTTRTTSTEGFYGPIWDDTDVWDDTLRWLDVDPLYTRVYIDDSKVTVMSNSKEVEILFRNNSTLATKGFELSTVNAEAFFSQRSTRTK